MTLDVLRRPGSAALRGRVEVRRDAAAAVSAHGLPEPQLAPLVRAMLVFRVLLTIVIAGADFLWPWAPSPLAWLTVGVSVLSVVGLVVRRPLRLIAVEAWLLPALLVLGGLVDTRAHLVPVPNPLDGYAIGTMSVVGAVWGWRGASRLLAATVTVEVALAVAEVGVGIDTLVLLSQRATWLAIAAAVTSHIRSQTAAAAAAVAAEAVGQERLAHLRALHDRAVQTLTAVVVGAADGWERVRREAPGLWERVRADAAAERDRLLAVDAGDPAPAADDVVGAVAGVVRAHASAPRVDLRTHGPPVVPARVAGAVARAVDEALTNVAKHAPGAATTVTIDGAPGRVDVRIEDSGAVGGDRPTGSGTGPAATDGRAAPRSPIEGFGISQSVRGRMAAVGGTAEVASRPGEGTTVAVSWRRASPGRRRWRGAAGVMPVRAFRGIIVAAVTWHLVASLSVLFVAWRLGWMRHPGVALLCVLLPAALLLAGIVLPVRRVVGDRMRRIAVPALLLLGPALVVAGGLLVAPQHLLLDYGDPMTSTGATCTAVVTFLAGPAVGAVALVATSAATVVAAPLLNGSALADVVTISSVERLVMAFIAWFLFVRIGPLLLESVAARRRAAVMRARIAESTAISGRLAPVLAAIADADEPGDAVRRKAFAALAWARLRLTGTSTPEEERVADALAAVAVWHPVVRRPPQITRVAAALPASAITRTARALDLLLEVLDHAGARDVAITAGGAAAELRVTVTCGAVGSPSAACCDAVLATLGGCADRVEVDADGRGVLVTVTVRAGAPMADGPAVPVGV